MRTEYLLLILIGVPFAASCGELGDREMGPRDGGPLRDDAGTPTSRCSTGPERALPVFCVRASSVSVNPHERGGNRVVCDPQGRFLGDAWTVRRRMDTRPGHRGIELRAERRASDQPDRTGTELVGVEITAVTFDPDTGMEREGPAVELALDASATWVTPAQLEAPGSGRLTYEITVRDAESFAGTIAIAEIVCDATPRCPREELAIVREPLIAARSPSVEEMWHEPPLADDTYVLRRGGDRDAIVLQYIAPTPLSLMVQPVRGVVDLQVWYQRDGEEHGFSGMSWPVPISEPQSFTFWPYAEGAWADAPTIVVWFLLPTREGEAQFRLARMDCATR